MGSHRLKAEDMLIILLSVSKILAFCQVLTILSQGGMRIIFELNFVDWYLIISFGRSDPTEHTVWAELKI